MNRYRETKDKYQKIIKLALKIGDKVICPDGSINTIIGYDTDIKLFFTFIQGAKCFIDGDDYILTN